MTLDQHGSLRALALLSLALGGCIPGSLSLGDEGELDPSSSSDSGTDGETEAPPLAEGVVRWSTIRPDFTGTDLAVAPNGSFYVLGQRGYTPQGDGGFYDDLWIGKYDADGAPLWDIFEPQDPEYSEYPVAISVDGLGDVYFATIDYDTSADGGNRVRKLDPDGNELWSVVLPGRAGALVALPGGGAIVGGSQDYEAWVTTLDVDGNLGWSRTFDGIPRTYSEITAVALTPDGGVALGGRLGLEVGSSRSQAWAATLELADGSDRWETPLTDGVATDRVVDVGVAADGTMLIAGASDEPWVKGLASDGLAEWSWPADIGGWATLASFPLTVFPDGGFALGDGIFLDMNDPDACHDGFSPCPDVMRVERFEPDRTPAWRLETSECNVALAMVPTADGGLLTLAACNPNSSSPGMGLYRFEP